MADIKFNYSIPFGTSLRVGYKIVNTSGPYTYVTYYPTYNESPYTIEDIAPGNYQIELVTVCPNCGGAYYSDPYILEAQAT